MTGKLADQRVQRSRSSSTSGGPLVVTYRIDGAEGRRSFDVELPHETTRLALARRLRAAAASLEDFGPTDEINRYGRKP